MNKVSCNIQVNQKNQRDTSTYLGSIWRDKDCFTYYIFAIVEANRYCLIDLSDGNRYEDSAKDFNTIIGDNILVAMSANITVNEVK